MSFIKKHVKLILVLVTVLTGTTWYLVKKENDYYTHVNRVTKKFINEMEKEHNLSCSTLGGELSRNVKHISLSFRCFQKKTIEEARELEVYCIERFCEIINANKKIRPHLEEFPFPNNRLIILIRFCKEDLTNFPREESISLVMNCKDKIFYEVVFNDERPDQTELEETYTEAYEKVNGIPLMAQQAL